VVAASDIGVSRDGGRHEATPIMIHYIGTIEIIYNMEQSAPLATGEKQRSSARANRSSVSPMIHNLNQIRAVGF
jgi:hypothetical protein